MAQQKIIYVFVATITCFIVGLFFARFLLSIALVILALFGISVWWNKNIKNNVYFKNIFVTHIIITFLFGLSYFWSEDQLTFWNNYKNILLLPFVLLSFYYLRFLNQRQKQFIFWIYNLAINLSILYSCYFLVVQSDLIFENYSKGQVLPTLIHHVGLSVLIVLNCLLNTFAFLKERKKLYLGIILFNIIFLHLFAVRTGIVLLYFVAFIFILSVIIKQKSFLKNSLLMLFFLLVGLMSYKTFPSIKNKIGYTVYDWQQRKNKNNNLEHLSDSRRLLSYKAACSIIQSNKILGVGLGDVQTEMKNYYQENLKIKDAAVYALPHNQYLFNTLAIGIVFSCIVLILYLINFGYFLKQNYKSALLYFIVLLVLFWEPFLAYQLGVSIYIISILFAQLIITND